MPVQVTEEREIDLDLIEGLLARGDRAGLSAELSRHHPADVARLMNGLDAEVAETIFTLLDPKTASEVIVEIADELRDHLLEEMESRRVSEIVDHMASDDAADLLGTLSEEDANRVLEHIPETEVRQVKDLLAYEEDTAGGIMQAEVAAVVSTATVQEAIAMLRENKDELDDIHNVFVTDTQGHLLGGFPLRKLVLESPDTPVSALMETDYISAHVEEDQEAVARLFKKYDLVSLPVTDGGGKLVGRITYDDIIDVMEEEASEDFFKMAGTGTDDTFPTTVLRSVRLRLPWLFASCLGGLVALRIIGTFQSSIGKIVALATFIPVILGMGGNIGTQSTTIVVRGLAIGSIDVNSLWRLVFKEIRIGFILGSLYGSFLALATAFIYSGNPALSLVVGLSMLLSMVLAATVGTMIPILFYKVGVDPAVATGPFVTTTVDIIGILILFNLATFFLFGKG